MFCKICRLPNLNFQRPLTPLLNLILLCQSIYWQNGIRTSSPMWLRIDWGPHWYCNIIIVLLSEHWDRKPVGRRVRSFVIYRTYFSSVFLLYNTTQTERFATQLCTCNFIIRNYIPFSLLIRSIVLSLHTYEILTFWPPF